MDFVSFLLVPLFLFFDRFGGGGFGWKATDWGRPIYYIALTLPVFVWLHLEPLLIGWLFWRAWGWEVLGSATNPQTAKAIAATFLRHCFIFIMLPLAYLRHYDLLDTGAACLSFALVATGLAAWFGVESEHGKDVNATVEMTRGAAFGLIFALLH